MGVMLSAVRKSERLRDLAMHFYGSEYAMMVAMEALDEYCVACRKELVRDCADKCWIDDTDDDECLVTESRHYTTGNKERDDYFSDPFNIDYERARSRGWED